MKTILKALTMSVAVLALGFAEARAQDVDADVMHWWTSGTEAAALRQLVNAYNAAGGHWKDRAVPDFESAIAAATSSVVNGSAPVALQFNAGSQFAELAKSGMLTDLTAYAQKDGWKDKISPPLLNAISQNGKIYAMPIDTHNQLWVWTSKKAFDKAGVAYPKNWTEFLNNLDALKKAGVIPIAQGGEPWQEMLLFEAVLLFRGSPDLFDAVFTTGDVGVIQGPEFKKAAEEFKHITSYIDKGAPGRKWNDTTAMVVKGDAAIQVMGDWAKSEFLAAGLKPDVDFGCHLGVGTSNYYVAVNDVFVLPRNEQKTDAQALFAKTVMDPKVQADFNRLKGGIPPRQDAVLQDPDVCVQKAVDLLKDPGAQRLAPTVTLTGDRFGAYGDAISQFVNSSDMTSDDFIASLVEAINSTAH